jgi:microcystin-dependent protein
MFDQPYLGNITIFAGNFAPLGWRFCDGSLLPISEYDALFSLIGTIYGGDGQVTFALPNLQSRVAIHAGASNGNTYVPGEMAGTESIIITQNQMPAHSHPFVAASGNPPANNSANNQSSPAGNVPSLAPQNLYNPSADGFGLAPAVGAGVTGPAGGSQPVSILSPYLAMNYIIAVFGIYPTQS